MTQEDANRSNPKKENVAAILKTIQQDFAAQQKAGMVDAELLGRYARYNGKARHVEGVIQDDEFEGNLVAMAGADFSNLNEKQREAAGKITDRIQKRLAEKAEKAKSQASAKADNVPEEVIVRHAMIFQDVRMIGNPETSLRKVKSVAGHFNKQIGQERLTEVTAENFYNAVKAAEKFGGIDADEANAYLDMILAVDADTLKEKSKAVVQEMQKQIIAEREEPKAKEAHYSIAGRLEQAMSGGKPLSYSENMSMMPNAFLNVSKAVKKGDPEAMAQSFREGSQTITYFVNMSQNLSGKAANTQEHGATMTDVEVNKMLAHYGLPMIDIIKENHSNVDATLGAMIAEVEDIVKAKAAQAETPKRQLENASVSMPNMEISPVYVPRPGVN